MSSSQLEEFDRFWARQGTSMSDHHLEERMRFNRETEAKKQRVIDNARLQLEDLRKRDLPPADFDHEAHKIGEARDVALVSIEKDHNERMRIVIDIQLKEVANHEKAHKEAIAVRSFMNATLPVHPAQAPMAAAAASPAVGNVEAANSGYITSGSRTPASMETGPPSHHTLLDNAFSTIRVSREQDRPAASEKTFSCTAQPLQKFPNFRTKPSPHADQSVVTSALTATKEPLVSRTITFDEVYQNGQAEHKDTIVEFPAESGQWYILKCEEHNLRFKQRPLQGAAKHLNGQLHGCLERAWPTAIRMLGYRVIDCTAAAAKKNNEAVDEAFANGYKPAGLQKIKKNRKRADAIPKLQGAISRAGLHGIASFSSSSGRRKTSQIEGITNPKAFHVYCCLWRPRFYPVVILGWDDQKPGGLEVRLSGTGLLDKTSNPPSCYIYHNAAIVGWAPGFEDGGPKVNQRKFPAMFFDNKFAWVHAESLKVFPLYKPDPPKKENHYFDLARSWIARREGFASWEEFEEAHKGKPNTAKSKSSITTPLAPTMPDTNDSDSESGEDSFTPSSISNTTEKELAEMQEQAGEISGDSDYSNSDMDSTFGDAQGPWGEVEADGRPWAFYSLRKKAHAIDQKAEATSSTQEGIKMARRFALHACTKREMESRDEPLKESEEELGQVTNGEASRSTPVKSLCVAPATEQMDSRIERSISLRTTRKDDGPTYAPIQPPQTVTKPGDVAKGVKRVRSVEPSETDIGASGQDMGKKPKLDMDASDTQMTTSVASEPLALPATPSLKPKVPLGPAAFELSSYRKGLTSWNREDEKCSARLYYGEGDSRVGTVDGPVHIVIDPKTLRALAQEKIPESRGNVLVTLLGQNSSEAPTTVVFDKAKGSRMDIGKIQVRGFIRWLKSVNPAIRLLDDRETAEELHKVAGLGTLDGVPS